MTVIHILNYNTSTTFVNPHPLIPDFLANGMSIEEILVEYPHLTEEDVRATIAYGAEMARERYVEIPTETRG